MKAIVSRVTGKGQITLPVEIQRHLGVHEGDELSFVIENSGAVLIQPSRYSTVESLAGSAGTLREPLSWDQVREIAREERIDEILRDTYASSPGGDEQDKRRR